LAAADATARPTPVIVTLSLRLSVSVLPGCFEIGV